MQDLEAWIKRLSDREMPVFARTARDVAQFAAKAERPVAELAQLIMRDASMTARVLRLANSSFYNPSGRTITTVSRALVMLGFNAVRSICLSIAVVDNLLKGVHRERVAAEMARSFHAAVQARELAVRCKHESPEEVFVAALLYRLGEMAFWCFSGEQGTKLDAALSTPGYTRERAEREVLGFPLRQLTAGLSREWRLGDLLQDALNGTGSGNARAAMVVMAHDLAQAMEQGWDSPQVARLVQRVADAVGISRERAADLVRNRACVL
jgi:HD-like signal output (HDOD) protein